MQELPEKTWKVVNWRQGTKGQLKSQFAAIRVQPSYKYENGKIDQKQLWLLAEWPEGETTPTKFWFSNLEQEASLQQLVRFAKIRWWIEQNYWEMKKELGMDHFEGQELAWLASPYYHDNDSLRVFGNRNASW
jgi:SRSO17 transposase